MKILLPILLLSLIQAAPLAAAGLSGRVVDPAGNPIPDVDVHVEPSNKVTKSDSNGEFRMAGLIAGEATVRFIHVAFESVVRSGIVTPTGRPFDLGEIILPYKIFDAAEISVTASRGDRSIYDVGNPVNIITGDMIAERNSKTTAEAIREEPGVFVQKTNHGGGSAIVRGFSSNQILLLVDGIRLNNSTYRLGNHQYLTTVDNQSADRIEVVRGPGSVLYGSDAMGGAIDVTSRKPVPGGVLGADFGFVARYASADDEKTINGSAMITGNRLAASASVSVKEYGHLRRGANSDSPSLENSTNGLEQFPTAFDGFDFNCKTVYSPGEDRELTASYQHSSQDEVPRYDKYENDDYHRWVYEPQERDLAYVVYDADLSGGSVRRIRANASWQRQEEGRQFQRTAGGELTAEVDEVRTAGAVVQFEGTAGDHLWTAGGEGYFDEVSSSRTITDQSGVAHPDSRGRYPDGATYASFGIFAQDEYQIRSGWSAIFGGRASFFETTFDSSSSGGGGDMDQSFRAVTASAAVIWQPAEKRSISAGVSQAFRAPNLSDITKLGQSKGSTYEIPNLDLGPERLTSIDIGLRLESGRLEFSSATYFGFVTDLMASGDTTWNGSPVIIADHDTLIVKTKKNRGNAHMYGVESSAAWRVNRSVRLSANATYTRGENTADNEPVGGVPPLFGRVGIDIHRSRWNTDLFVRWAARQDRLSADDLDDPRIPAGGTPGWWTLNARASWQWTNRVASRIAIENLLDKNYREHGSGVNGPGINLILALERRF